MAREIEKLVPSLLVSCDMVGIDSFRCEFKEYVVMEKTQICIHHLNHIYHRIKRFLPSKDLISKMIKIEANGNTILAPEKIYVHEASAPELTEKLPYHIEYTHTDAFIEKAEKYLKSQFIKDVSVLAGGVVHINFEMAIENFVKYMKGE